MAPRIRADRNAAETGKKRARAKAEKAFKPKPEAADAAGPRDLKQTTMELGLAAALAARIFGLDFDTQAELHALLVKATELIGGKAG